MRGGAARRDGALEAAERERAGECRDGAVAGLDELVALFIAHDDFAVGGVGASQRIGRREGGVSLDGLLQLELDQVAGVQHGADAAEETRPQERAAVAGILDLLLRELVDVEAVQVLVGLLAARRGEEGSARSLSWTRSCAGRGFGRGSKGPGQGLEG